jgi:hypothetical protein
VQALDALRLVLGWQLAIVLQTLQIAPGAENSISAGDEHAAHFGVRFGCAQSFDPSGIYFRPQRVAKCWVAEGQYQGLTFAGAEQLSSHFFSSSVGVGIALKLPGQVISLPCA